MFPEIFRDDVFRLETQRLWLRWPTARDECAIERLAGDPAVAEMTARVPHPYPKGGAASFIYAARVGNAQGSGLTFMLTPVARPHEAIGAVSLSSENDAVTLGYWLGKPHWGRGLMSEAVDALMGAVFQLTRVAAIAAQTRADNAPSRRVLEKTGFAPTGTRRMHFAERNAAFDCVTFARQRETRAVKAAEEERGVSL